MARLVALLLLPALLTLAGCAGGMPGTGTAASDAQAGSSGKAGPRMVPKIYRIHPSETATIQFRMLDAVNALRAAARVGPLQLNARLNAAAATHSRDMSRQNRPWHFGSDGSSPLDRVRRVGYAGALVGETISETYETELETLAAWMEEEDTRRVLLDPEANEMGFAWQQEASGKIWWTLVLGRGAAAAPAS
ncbi:MAG: CAP domain-containing protein [Roseovarius sp.]